MPAVALKPVGTELPVLSRFERFVPLAVVAHMGQNRQPWEKRRKRTVDRLRPARCNPGDRCNRHCVSSSVG